MAVPARHADDLQALVAKQHDNGGDFWASADGRWGVGSPFSTFDVALMLSELGMPVSDPIMQGTAGQFLAAWREDGRIGAAPKGPIYPCYTANATRALCRLGYARDRRLKVTFEHLLSVQHDDGGWRCKKKPLGISNAMDASNPGVTLAVLDAFRFTNYLNTDHRLDMAVDSLLKHWETREPMGPCGFGIGSRFSKTEYPFLRYNIFFYVYVLSFYEVAKRDRRFQAALSELVTKQVDGKIIVESPNRRLANFSFCRRGEPSEPASRRLREIQKNVV